LKVGGKWKYLWRAIDKQGRRIDFMLSDRRNTKAAYRFPSKALKHMKNWQPTKITTDKLASYPRAITRLKREGILAASVVHRQSKYLNNIIESDHGKLKRLIKPTLGFKSMPTAYATIKGFEVMRAMHKNQARPWCLQPGAKGEIRLIERAFGLGKDALVEASEILQEAMEKQAA
jgi:transposase, IS6 family